MPKPMLFKPVEIPDTCYIQEVAYWIAFGRVPEFFFGEGEEDQRTDRTVEYGDDLPLYDLGYTQMELVWAGVKVDYARYSRAVTASNFRTGAEHIKKVESQFSLIQPDELDSVLRAKFQKYRDKMQAEADELDWARSVDVQLDNIVDIARASTFQAIASGKLSTFGWVDKPTSDVDDKGIKGSFEDIPANNWSMRNFVWEESQLTTPHKFYRSVQVKTQDMLEVFPTPSCEPSFYKLSAYPGVFTLDDDGDLDETISAAQPRGRAAKLGGAIRLVVQNVFGDRIRKGSVPLKMEALVQEVIDYVGLAFGEKISRSTAQAYLAPLRASMPEIHASK